MDNAHKRDDVQASENMSAPPLPPKYVMLNESNSLRPPPQRRNLPRYHTPQHESGRNCCLKCICCCYCCLFFLIIALSIAGYVIYATFEVDIPKYKVEQFNVKAFNVLPDFSLNTELNLIVRAENPSDLISLQYGRGISVTMNYMDKVICSGKVPKFYQDHKSVKRLDIPLKGKTEFSSGLQESLAEDKKEGKIPLLIIVKAPIIVELGKIPLKEVIINFNITIVVDSLETGKKIRIISSTYNHTLVGRKGKKQQKSILLCILKPTLCECASKKLIKQLQRRLKLLKNKRFSIVRLLREDIEELLKIGHEETALNRADQLFQDENIMAVYELLDNFCEFISMNMSYIRKRKEIPNDINEAVSSLVFASSRCGELPELRVIRKLFEERYGQRFAVDTAELFPGNLVNFQIEERLSITSVPDYVKHQLVDEIAKDCCLRPELLALEYTSELQQVLEKSVYQELDKDVYTCYSLSEECERKTSNENKMQDIYVDSLLTGTKATRPNESCSHSHQNSDAVSISFCSSIVQQPSPDASNSPMTDKAEKVENVAQLDAQIGFKSADDRTKQRQMNGRKNISSCSESLPHFDEERQVYLDEIQEFQSSLRKDGDCQDQRLFKFKQSVMPKTETADGCNESSMGQYESLSEKSSSRSSRKSAKASGKQPRRRSLSLESSGMKDIECEIYYEKPYKSPANKHRSHSHRKQQKKPTVEESKQTFYAHKRPIQAFCKESDEDEKERDFQHCKLQIGTIEKPNLPQKPRRKSYDDKGATEYSIFTYSDRRLKEQIQSNNGKAKASDCLMRCAASEEAVSRRGNKLKPPYLTVNTMPAERTKEKCTDNILRCSSFPCQYPDHVHPKLPNYDDIAAKFMALKKELLQKKC